MTRAVLLLVSIPTVIYANDEVVQPSCASPASLEPRAPRSHGGDRIVFRTGTDLHVGIAILEQTYSLSVHFLAKDWDVSSDGVFVPPLTHALQMIMATKKPGDTVTMEVIRNGVEMRLVAQF